MGLVSTWTRQLARAAGASLIAPVALLLAAGVVAAGSGLGGIGSLGQIASGPRLPDIGLTSAPSPALQGADIVGAEVSEPTAPAPPSRPTGPLASAAQRGRAPAGRGDGTLSLDRGPRPPPGRVRPPARPETQGEAGAPAPTAPSPPPPAAPPTLVDGLLETTRGVGKALPGPLGPITSDILNLLLGPPRR